MNILDENILASQRQLLKSWRIRIRQIGYDLGRKGMQDEEIVSFLHQQRHSTFFTRDLGWYERTLCHRRYGVVCMSVEKEETAVFVRRVLRHPELNTQAKRMGAVIRVSPTGLRLWRLNAEEEIYLEWNA